MDLKIPGVCTLTNENEVRSTGGEANPRYVCVSVRVRVCVCVCVCVLVVGGEVVDAPISLMPQSH